MNRKSSVMNTEARSQYDTANSSLSHANTSGFFSHANTSGIFSAKKVEYNEQKFSVMFFGQFSPIISMLKSLS